MTAPTFPDGAALARRAFAAGLQQGRKPRPPMEPRTPASALALRLRALADRGELPAQATAVLEAAVGHAAVRRAVRDERIGRLAALVGGAGEVYALLSGEAWRWALWRARGVPARASAAERLAFEAWAWGPAVSRRQIERILRHAQGVQCRATPATLAGITTRRY